MVTMKTNLRMAMTITSMLKFAVQSTCYETKQGVNGTYGTYFNALTPTYYPSNGECSDFFVPITVDYQAPEFNATRWANAFELQDALSIFTASSRAGYPAAFGAMKQFKGSYEIAASFCTPRNTKDGKEKTVIVATHGIGPGRAHWNSPFKPEKYNFVQHALDKGYSVFFYDRLGCGASSKVSGFEAQLTTAKVVLQQLASLVKSGKYTCKIRAEKVAVLGFSFGSYTTHAAIAETPEIADAVILTGIGLNATGMGPAAPGINGNGLLRSFVPRIATVENPALYGDRDAGYLTWPSVYDLVMNYFKAPAFEQDVAVFTESAKQPFAIAEFLTFGAPAGVSAEKWDKPALHVTGELDYIVCDGDCNGIYDEPAKTYYRNAKPLQQHLVKGASHHVNFHISAQETFSVITDFLDKNLA